MLEDAEEQKRPGLAFEPPVYIQRYQTVKDLLYKIAGIRKVADFGCAEGKFLKYLKNLPFVTEIVGVDVSDACSQAAFVSRPKAWDFVFKRHQPLSIKIFQGDVTQIDSRLQGFDAVTCIELIEHMEKDVLQRLPGNIFGYIHPKVAIFTTPNSEFNVLFEDLKGYRHWDHKFEWSRNEFRNWCISITDEYPEYNLDIRGIGDGPEEHSNLGSCTQMAIFRIKDNKFPVPEIDIVKEPYKLIDENIYPGRDTQQTSSDLTSEDTENIYSSQP